MIKIYHLTDSMIWDKIISTFENYDTYWLSGYVKAFQVHGDGEPILVYYVNQDASLRAANVVMKRDISEERHFQNVLQKNQYYDFSTPYGYGGWLIDNPNNEPLDSFISEYETYCRENHIISEFVRFHPLVKNHVSIQDYYEVVPLGEVVTVDLTSKEAIWENFTSKNRNVIRKAQKNGVKIYNGRYPEIYRVFRTIYNQTMNKDHADQYYYFEKDFYDSLLNDLPEEAQVFYAELPDETIISAAIILFVNQKMNYHLSGSLTEYSSLAATNLLLYKAALWGNANGYKTFYLGGGVGSSEDGLFKFKRAFYKGELNRFYIGKKIFDRDKYEDLCELSHVDQKEQFFPKYRCK